MKVDGSNALLAAGLALIISATAYLYGSTSANSATSGALTTMPPALAVQPGPPPARPVVATMGSPATITPTVDSTKLGGCAAIPGTLERLQCYDALAIAKGVAPSSLPAADESGKWQLDQSINPVDDTKTVILSTTAGNVKSRFDKDIDLVLRCQSGQTEAYIVWNSFLGSDGIETILRIDSRPAAHETWSLSSDKEAAFYPGNKVRFIKSLMNSTQVVVQVSPYDESPVTAIFDTSGLASVIKPLADACKWGAK